MFDVDGIYGVSLVCDRLTECLFLTRWPLFGCAVFLSAVVISVARVYIGVDLRSVQSGGAALFIGCWRVGGVMSTTVRSTAVRYMVLYRLLVMSEEGEHWKLPLSDIV